MKLQITPLLRVTNLIQLGGRVTECTAVATYVDCGGIICGTACPYFYNSPEDCVDRTAKDLLAIGIRTEQDYENLLSQFPEVNI